MAEPTPKNGIARVDQYLAETGDWRGEVLSAIRNAILSVDQGIVEEFKWMGSPVWSRDGMIAVGNAHKQKVKITFSYGASLPDPANLFNGDDKGATRRSIDVFEGDALDLEALKELVRAGIAYNRTHLRKHVGKAGGGKAK